MNDFLNFRRMITPAIIQILFWIGLAVSILSGIGTLIFSFIAAGTANSQGAAGVGVLLVFAGLIGGILQAAFGVLLTRIWCELIILSFRIYDTLGEIRDGGRGLVIPPAQTYPAPVPQPNPAYPQA